jgi:hypothetical protein
VSAVLARRVLCGGECDASERSQQRSVDVLLGWKKQRWKVRHAQRVIVRRTQCRTWNRGSSRGDGNVNRMAGSEVVKESRESVRSADRQHVSLMALHALVSTGEDSMGVYKMFHYTSCMLWSTAPAFPVSPQWGRR